MPLQNSQREIQEAGLRTPYTFTSNKGGIKLACVDIHMWKMFIVY